MSAEVWAAVLGGALGGSVITAAITLITARANWRREDRNRFAATKLEVYTEFATTAAALSNTARHIDLSQLDETSRLTRATVRTLTRYVRNARRLKQADDRFVVAWQRLMIFAPEQLQATASAIAHLREEEEMVSGKTDEFDARVAMFIIVARADLGNPPHGWYARRRAERAAEINDKIVRQLVDEGIPDS